MAHTLNLSVMGPKNMDGEPDYAIMSDGRIVGKAYGRSDSNHLEPSFGNALLWAAAPDLLAACKRALDYIRCVDYYACEENEVAEELANVIDIAEGRESK